MTTAFDFTVNDIHGEPVELADYRGKVLLIVNTASKCGFTPQYRGCRSCTNAIRRTGWWCWASL